MNAPSKRHVAKQRKRKVRLALRAGHDKAKASRNGRIEQRLLAAENRVTTLESRIELQGHLHNRLLVRLVDLSILTKADLQKKAQSALSRRQRPAT